MSDDELAEKLEEGWAKDRLASIVYSNKIADKLEECTNKIVAALLANTRISRNPDNEDDTIDVFNEFLKELEGGK